MPRLTEPTYRFICALLDERDIYNGQYSHRQQQDPTLTREGFKHELKERATKLEQHQASRWIELLKAKPKLTPAGSPQQGGWPNVPEGRYAVEHEGSLKFYEVDKPTEGRWAGYTFLNVRASDERHAIRNPASKRAILELIAKDPKGASIRFGHELGRCGICGRSLTKDTSRAAGIGPVCAEKVGW